ncbi:hypothetical protein, partial [Methylobacterium indicum]|uniref:hypothetical protein n=1 Tax=Methylobacterium indicum TaxID=1775910 RepID=UPI000791FB36
MASIGLTTQAPPHPRGSTLDHRLEVIADDGSPASAGIDPSVSVVLTLTIGLPRIRGDRPLPELMTEPASM